MSDESDEHEIRREMEEEALRSRQKLPTGAPGPKILWTIECSLLEQILAVRKELGRAKEVLKLARAALIGLDRDEAARKVIAAIDEELGKNA